MARFNLESPNQLSQKCALDDLTRWALTESSSVTDPAPRDCIATVCKALGSFIRWPAKAVLLWHGCDRIAPKSARQRIHSFPDLIRRAAKAVKAPLDNRSNGPAIVAFLVSGGIRPKRFGSQNSWSIHHIYSGKFPYIGKSSTLHAAKSGQHFTQSAGVVPCIRSPMESATSIHFLPGFSARKPFADLDTILTESSLIRRWTNLVLFPDERPKSSIKSQ